MSRPISILLALLFVVVSAIPVTATEPGPPDEPDPPTSPEAGEVVPGEVVVKWREPARSADVTRSRGLAVATVVEPAGSGTTEVVSTQGRPVEAVLAELRADPAVEYAEPNYVVYQADEGDLAAAVPVNDPMSSGQYALTRMRVRDAWSLSKGGNGIVAVLDTGVQANHPDLSGRVLAGHDFVNNDTGAADDNGHGTWVAGLIAAKPNDGYGIAGISWTDRILPVKIMNGSGLGDTADLTSGIVWAANHGATVINMSVGGFPYSQYVQDAVNYAWSKGAVLVGAAGNNRREESFFPASFANVVSASATQEDDEFTNWSSYGPNVDVSAPGASILTTNCTVCTYAGHNTWGSHVTISGTSFATPNTAGVIALIRARFPTYTPAQVVSRLFSTVDDLGYRGADNRYGRGRVNAYRALGGTIAAPGIATGDALEPNNALNAARAIPIGTTTRPSIHPAGDADVLAVDVPRAGRLDVRVSGVVDSTRPVKSALPIDPIVELYSTGGGLLARVDNVWESGTELAAVNVGAPSRILIRVSNFYPNGNRAAYGITPTFVDNVAPTLAARSPAPGAVRVSYDGAVISATFSEPVSGVSGSTFQLKTAAGALVPASVGYAAASRRATLRPSAPLAPEAVYQVLINAGIKDALGLGLAPTSWTFTSGKAFPRIAGPDRYATSAALSAATFSPGVAVAYIANGQTFPDALAGGPAARVGNGPLLLSASGELPAPIVGELSRLRPGRIVILGGTGGISGNVQSQLAAFTTGSVTRVAGVDRYATAAAVSRSVWTQGAPTVYVATGEGYADALSASAVASRNRHPILLVRQGAIPAATLTELNRLAPDRIVVMGGSAVISDAVLAQLRTRAPSVTRIAGADRYETSVKLSAATFAANGVTTAYVASGTSFPDGLSVGPIAGRANAPLLLVPPTGLPGVVANELRRLDPTSVVFVGGTTMVSDTVRNQVRAIWP